MTTHAMWRLLNAAADERLYVRVSSAGTLDVYEKPPAVEDLSAEMAAWIGSPRIRPNTVRSAIRSGFIQQDGPIGADRWARYAITPAGFSVLPPAATRPTTEEEETTR